MINVWIYLNIILAITYNLFDITEKLLTSLKKDLVDRVIVWVYGKPSARADVFFKGSPKLKKLFGKEVSTLAGPSHWWTRLLYQPIRRLLTSRLHLLLSLSPPSSVASWQPAREEPGDVGGKESLRKQVVPWLEALLLPQQPHLPHQQHPEGPGQLGPLHQHRRVHRIQVRCFSSTPQVVPRNRNFLGKQRQFAPEARPAGQGERITALPLIRLGG